MIAIIDDDESVRVATASLVRSFGFKTTVFESAEAFLTSPSMPETDCLVTDVQMPGSMDGVKLAHYVRERFPPTVLFVVSGNLHIPDSELPPQTTFLPKPFDAHRLLRQLEAAQPR